MNTALDPPPTPPSQKPAKRFPLTPGIAGTLALWQYMEYSILRLIAGWGRSAGPWEDKRAVCYHVWLQAEVVQRLRSRLEQFPPHKAEIPVHPDYQALGEAVLLAPTWPEVAAGIYGVLNGALSDAYTHYLGVSHPVHDQPTLEMLREIVAIKRIQTEWYQDFEARHPGVCASETIAETRRRLDALRGLSVPLTPVAPFAEPCGKNSAFRMSATPGRVDDWDCAPNIMPLIELDWSDSVEARRLFFMIGYFWEMGVAEKQLRWLFYADFMPWEYVYAEARHLWDESRHGDSGLTRLRELGLDIKDVGYNSYGASGDGVLAPLTPHGLYEEFYMITQIAERGFFKTKTYCMEDFAAGGDAASAEMMQFDILDETTHAEYGRRWLSLLAERAGVEENWLARGAADRDASQKRSEARVAAYRRFVADGNPDAPLFLHGAAEGVMPGSSHRVLLDADARAHYERLLKVVREKCPLSNGQTAPTRPALPM